MRQLVFTVLDTSMAIPAEGLAWRLQWVQGPAKMQKGEGVTDKLGQPQKPLPQGDDLGDDLPSGIYELHLKLADYFKRQGWQLPEPPIMDEITLRFYIEEGSADYHLHVQIMPHSYNFAIMKNDGAD